MARKGRIATDDGAPPASDSGEASHDPVLWVSRIRTALHTRWIRRTYPFCTFGDGNSIDYTCQLFRTNANRIALGSRIYIAKDCWFPVVAPPTNPSPSIILGDGCRIGRRSTISSRNMIRLEEDVLFAPEVFLMDHAHEYADVHLPIHAQGLTEGGTIIVERNCWLGYGACVFSEGGELRIGRNSVIGAHSVVLESIPPYSVAVGSPARVVKRFDPNAGEWVRVGGSAGAPVGF